MTTALLVLAILGLCSGCTASLIQPPPREETPTNAAFAAEAQDALSTPEIAPTSIAANLQLSPEELAPDQQQACPNVDSMLVQILQSPDPLETAAQLQLNVDEDRLQVVITLQTEDTSVLQDFDAQLGSQSGSQVQAFIAPSQICDLANRSEVLRIQLPELAAPQR